MPFPRKPAPRKCSIKDCKSTCKTNTTFFFPKNEKLRKKWIKIISYSNPQFAQLKDSEIMKLGICDEHFMLDQFDDDGRRKRNAYPNLITQKEVIVGVPIISYDSDSDDERKKSKRRRLSIKSQPVQESVSLPSILPRKGPPIQGSQEIQNSNKIVEDVAMKNDNVISNFCFESPLRNNVEAAKIKIEVAKSKKEDVETKIKATPNKMYAAKSKIEATKTKTEATPIKMVAKQTKNKSSINLLALGTKDSEALPVPKEEVEIDWDVNNYCQALPVPKEEVEMDWDMNNYCQALPVPKEEVEMDWDINNYCQSNDVVSVDYKQEVLYEDDQMSVKSFKQDVLVEEEVDLGVDTKVNITLLDTSSSEGNEVVTDTESSDKEVTTDVPLNNTIGLLSNRNFECTNFALFGSLCFEDVVDSKQTTTAADEPLTVDVTNVTKVTAKDIPTLSESQINILKKSVSKKHGEVEVMSMFYQGDDINVIMVNAQGKRVQLKLSKTANVEPVADKPTLPSHKNAHSEVLSKNSKKPTIKYIMDRQKTPKKEIKKWSGTCCGITFQHLSMYRDHFRTTHPGLKNPLMNEKTICEICGLLFQKRGMRRHLANHADKKL